MLAARGREYFYTAKYIRDFVLHYLSPAEVASVDEANKERKRDRSSTGECAVCNEKIKRQIHYGVMTCEGCKAFFKRMCQKMRLVKCIGVIEKNKCLIIEGDYRRRCQKCRMRKCLLAGLHPRAVRKDHASGGRNQSAIYRRSIIDADEEGEQRPTSSSAADNEFFNVESDGCHVSSTSSPFDVGFAATNDVDNPKPSSLAIKTEPNFHSPLPAQSNSHHGHAASHPEVQPQLYDFQTAQYPLDQCANAKTEDGRESPTSGPLDLSYTAPKDVDRPKPVVTSTSPMQSQTNVHSSWPVQSQQQRAQASPTDAQPHLQYVQAAQNPNMLFVHPLQTSLNFTVGAEINQETLGSLLMLMSMNPADVQLLLYFLRQAFQQ